MSTRTARAYRGRHHRRSSTNRPAAVAAAAIAVLAATLIAAEPPTSRQAIAAAPDPDPAQIDTTPAIVVGLSPAGAISTSDRTAHRASRSAQRAAKRAVRPIRRLAAVRTRRAHAATAHRSKPLRAFGAAEIAVDFALAQVGDAYDWAASGPNAWDCSGLVAGAYAHAGVELPHQSMAILGSRHVRRIGRSELRRGDLVWPQHGHIAIYLGDGRIVHAANEREGVRISPLYAFMAGGRVV